MPTWLQARRAGSQRVAAEVMARLSQLLAEEDERSDGDAATMHESLSSTSDAVTAASTHCVAQLRGVADAASRWGDDQLRGVQEQAQWQQSAIADNVAVVARCDDFRRDVGTRVDAQLTAAATDVGAVLANITDTITASKVRVDGRR